MMWKGFQRPNRLEVDEESGNYGRFTAQPLERGWGTTVGNALRRVLLSSIEGAAITAVKIDGVEHEFTAMPGVVEDVTDVILNLKSLAIRMHEDGPRTIVLDAKSKGVVTADAFEDDAQVEILNSDAPIATLADGGRLRLEATVTKGRGLRSGRPELRRRGPDRHDPARLGALAGPPRELPRRGGPRRPGDGLRQARPRGLDERHDDSPGRRRGRRRLLLREHLAIFVNLERTRAGPRPGPRFPRASSTPSSTRTSRSWSSPSAARTV